LSYTVGYQNINYILALMEQRATTEEERDETENLEEDPRTKE
jgi:hypothetical protein